MKPGSFFKFAFALFLFLSFSGCSIFDIINPGPSVCETEAELGRSYLCEIVDSLNLGKLENLATGVELTNSFLIGRERYTAEQARSELIRLRDQIREGITYILFGKELKASLKKYPGMFNTADLFIKNAAFNEVITPRDESYLIWFIERQLDILSEYADI